METELSGLILSGNPGYNAVAPLGASAAHWAQKRFGERAMLKPLTIGMFVPFRLKARARHSPNGWICSDRAVVQAYDDDPPVRI